MKRVVVCAGGPDSEVAELTEFRNKDTLFIGADRGALHLLERGIVPDVAVGDFDSISKEEYKTIAEAVRIVDSFNSEKDETDTELAVERALTYNPDQIILTGVTGGRLDHTASALHLLYRLQKENPAIRFSILNPLNELMMINPGTYQLTRNERLPYVSFFSFGGRVSNLSLSGFKYETTEATLEMGMTKFTSNELADDLCTISFHKGICLVVRSSDA